MLKINRLRVEINTVKGVYGIDERFCSGMNFIASRENTCGKSSILEAIYYCLGFEQILGGASGIGSKVLTSAFKTTIEDNGEPQTVTESGVYLEISNGFEVKTIYRNIKSENKNNHLVTVFHGSYDSISKPETLSADYYVNFQNSATSGRGFHTFLENFLHMELPLVRTSDGNERKLYLQVVFAAMFIEQKHGWSDILSGMPIFGIRESKKRIVEFVLNLETIKNEKERDRLNTIRTKLEYEWGQLIEDLKRTVHSEMCEIINLPIHPKVLSENDCLRIKPMMLNGTSIEDAIKSLEADCDALRDLKPRVNENFELLSTELSETQKQIASYEKHIQEVNKRLVYYDEVIKRLREDLILVKSDIRNNNDAARLQKFGSETLEEGISANICPVCKQHIEDNLFDVETASGFMSIEENIRHLKEQKKMLEFTLGSRKEERERLIRDKENLKNRLQQLQRLAYALRSDLYTTVNTEDSETIVFKRIEIRNRIDHLSKMRNTIDSLIEQLKNLSDKWNDYLDQKGKLPRKDISEEDEEKIILLRKRFVENLKRYHYSSLTNFDGIDISMNSSLLPTIDGFDMKFDSSASDGIRVIWAFTMALLQVSVEKEGNHPGIIIFDEPAQQSIVPEDMKSFIESAMEIKGEFQIITAITLNSQELISIIEGLDTSRNHKIQIEGKAFKILNKTNKITLLE